MLCIVAFPLFFVFYTVHMINERKKIGKKGYFRRKHNPLVSRRARLSDKGRVIVEKERVCCLRAVRPTGEGYGIKSTCCRTRRAIGSLAISPTFTVTPLRFMDWAGYDRNLSGGTAK